MQPDSRGRINLSGCSFGFKRIALPAVYSRHGNTQTENILFRSREICPEGQNGLPMRAFYRFLHMAAMILLVLRTCKAQDRLLDDSIPKISYGSFGVSYLSNNVYMGRKDSVKLPYITPTLGYFHKSGLYITGSVSYLPTAGNSRVDLVTLEAGYAYELGHFEGQISADKFYFSAQSTNVRSEIQGSITLAAGYDFGFIKPVVAGGISFGLSPDYALGLGIEHTFYALHQNLDITPNVMANASTQNFYGSYYSKRRYTGKRKRKTTGIHYYDISADLSDVEQFKLLDWECTLPINYTFKRFTINFSPSFAYPVNAAVVTYHIKPSTGPSFSRTSTELLSNSFFFQTGVTYQF